MSCDGIFPEKDGLALLIDIPIFQVFIKKEEMVRHYKWHKKRDESLQHGFMRYSPLDDCSTKFGSCTHNRRQTHYHCVQVIN